MAAKTRVTVAEGWAVYVHGQQHSGGDTVEMDTDTALHWIRRGWAVEATGTTTKAKTGTTTTTNGRSRSKRPTAPSR